MQILNFLLPQINVISAMIVLIMHKHRFIILRRLALILGLLYGYRAITMFVTNLPKADPNYFCAEKVRYIMSGQLFAHNLNVSKQT